MKIVKAGQINNEHIRRYSISRYNIGYDDDTINCYNYATNKYAHKINKAYTWVVPMDELREIFEDLDEYEDF